MPTRPHREIGKFPMIHLVRSGRPNQNILISRSRSPEDDPDERTHIMTDEGGGRFDRDQVVDIIEALCEAIGYTIGPLDELDAIEKEVRS